MTYVDVCLSGCLGHGKAIAHDFLSGTQGWGGLFLYDTPTSRRPWLARPSCWRHIDEILEEHGVLQHRKHPEDYAAAYLQGEATLRGCWNLPRRNPVFSGREAGLTQLEARLVASLGEGGIGVAQVAVTGGGTIIT